MHCENPTCVSVCPVGAFTKTDFGPVLYDESKCIGCRYCMQACPFQVPTYTWNETAPRVRKCIFCHERLAQGLRQLMAGCRKFAPQYISPDDLAALTREASEVSGIPYVMDLDKAEVDELLA